jgi:hypothetical protein
MYRASRGFSIMVASYVKVYSYSRSVGTIVKP